jgi:hypothetical protein
VAIAVRADGGAAAARSRMPTGGQLLMEVRRRCSPHVETYGRLGTPAMWVLTRWAGITEGSGHVDKSIIVTSLQELTAGLCRESEMVARAGKRACARERERLHR